MKNRELVEKNIKNILPELNSWAETFNPENIIYIKNNIEEDEEINLFKTYGIVKSLVERLEKGLCNENDYKNILFHINQINCEKI